MITNEPVRGGFPDPSFFSLPGIEQARAFLRGLVPRTPLGHLVGLRPTQVGSGSATVTMPASPWLQNTVGTLDLSTLIDATFTLAVLTGAPPASEVRTAALSVKHLRPCTVESETLVARAQVLNTGRRFTLAELLVEDGLGRAVAHATASVLIRPMEPPPPSTLGAMTPVEMPAYPTPDPYLRPTPAGGIPSRAADERPPLSVLRMVIAGELPKYPAHELLGVRLVEGAEGTLSLTMRTSEWLCRRAWEVAAGVIASLSFFASSGVVYTLSPGGHTVGVLDESVSFLRPVLPDGRELLARGTVTHRSGDLLISGAEVTDADGNTVAVGHSTALLIPRHRTAPSGVEPERVLATVLFTDIVGSTERAEELGDARWGELLEEHHGLVRKQLQLFKGREVKTTGDGFLATFDSPGRAVQCARAIRDGVWRLGLEVRAGLHTGECEVSGTDVAGIAVHLASRVQSLAGPGEILVSGTVRDLVTGSGLRFADRGRHQLKGIEGDWPLFAVTD